MPTEKDAHGVSQWTFVPADCVGMLPFKSEPLIQWRRGDDLSRFCHRLGTEDEMELDADDDEEESTDATDDMLELADKLSARSEETYHERGNGKVSPKIDYRADPALGGFAKAWVAWREVETELLTENGSFSLAHTLEATSDIACGLELIKGLFYRQAHICLRTFIEDLIFPLYFMHHEAAFQKWKAGQGSLPTMRGDKGILADLVQRNALDAGVADRLGKAYGEGNRFVHGSADSLINAGIFSRDWRGHSFKAAELSDWLVAAKECLECGICVVKRTADDWLKTTRNRPHYCRRCHATDFMAKEHQYRAWVPVEIDIGGVKITLTEPKGPRPKIFEFVCRRCGQTWHGTEPTKVSSPLASETSSD